MCCSVYVIPNTPCVAVFMLYLTHYVLQCCHLPPDEYRLTANSSKVSLPVQPQGLVQVYPRYVQVHTHLFIVTITPDPIAHAHVDTDYDSGVLQADPRVIREHNQIFRLYCHECQRVFHDRLIDCQDKAYFNAMLSEMASKHFSKVCCIIINSILF